MARSRCTLHCWSGSHALPLSTAECSSNTDWGGVEANWSLDQDTWFASDPNSRSVWRAPMLSTIKSLIYNINSYQGALFCSYMYNPRFKHFWKSNWMDQTPQNWILYVYEWETFVGDQIPFYIKWKHWPNNGYAMQKCSNLCRNVKTHIQKRCCLM